MNKTFYSLLALSLVISYISILNAGAGLYDRMREDRLYDNSGASNSSRSGTYSPNNNNFNRSDYSSVYYYSSPYNTKDQQSGYYYYNAPQPQSAGGPRTSDNYYYHWDTPNR